MRVNEIALLGHLAWEVPELRKIFDEHLDDNRGEILPHPLMSEYERWAEFAARQGLPGLATLLTELDDAFDVGDEAVRELIGVSFLERLPDPDDDRAALRRALGPTLSAELARVG